MSSLDLIHQRLRDIDPEFVVTFAKDLAWRYGELYDELKGDDSLSLDYKKEVFARRKVECALRALSYAAKKHGVPYEFRKLPCNGQCKIFLKMGRMVLIQEAMQFPTDAPHASDYKRELADAHGLIRQLELDLGDQPNRIHDWGGEVLGVVLHGAAGLNFTREDKELGFLLLGVPDAAYSQWVIRLDLHRIAMWGAEIELEVGVQHADAQPDNVHVTLKSNPATKSSR